MADDPKTPGGNGAEPPEAPRTLRDVAEAAWVEIGGDDPDFDDDVEGDEAPPSDGRPRDAQGRFVSKDPNEGEQTEEVPAPPEVAPPAEDPAHPAPKGSSNEAPQHWAPEDRAMFAKLPQEGRDFLLKRHGDMERDYTAKAQAAASAVNFAEALAPIFDDPVIAKSLNDVGANPYHAISEWASFHKRAMSNDPNERMGLLRDLAGRMKFDPAAVFAGQGSTTTTPLAGIPPEVAETPAFKYIADQLSTALESVSTLKSQLSEFQTAGEKKQQQDEFERTRSSIYAFADEVDAKGQKLRPDFDIVIPQILSLMRADPKTPIKDAYETARWMNPETRQKLLAAGQTNQQQVDNVRRAQAAVRSNVRGSTTVPVAKPKETTGKRSLRDVIEESAEEVGFE